MEKKGGRNRLKDGDGEKDVGGGRWEGGRNSQTGIDKGGETGVGGVRIHRLKGWGFVGQEQTD